MKTPLLSFALALLLFGLSPPLARAQQTHVDLGALLQKTGLKYSSVSNAHVQVWKIPYDNGKGGTVDEYLTYSNDKDQFGLIFMTVVHRQPYYQFSRALLATAMQINNDKVGIKFVLDGKHGDIDCQTEIYLPTATPATLKRAMNDVAYTATAYWDELNRL